MIQEGDEFQRTFFASERVYQLFIDAFEDRNPLHVDPVFAKGKAFEDKVLHGAILVGFLSNFVGECLPIKNVLVQSYRIDFVKPVYPNTELFFWAKAAGVFESVSAVEFKFRFKNGEGQTVARGRIDVGILNN